MHTQTCPIVFNTLGTCMYYNHCTSIISNNIHHDAIAQAIACGQLHAGNISADAIRRIGMADHDARGRLDYGRKILRGQDELAQYLWSYGNMVRRQWQGFFELQPVHPNGAFQLADYGCGQGLAMANVLDLADAAQRPSLVQGITLVEPSADALARASALAGLYLPQLAPHAMNCHIEQVRNNLLPYSATGQYLHLFSNVLDIASFNPATLLGNLLHTPGRHTLWAVSHNRGFDGGAPLLQHWAACLAQAAQATEGVQLHQCQLDEYPIAMSSGHTAAIAWQAQWEVA